MTNIAVNVKAVNKEAPGKIQAWTGFKPRTLQYRRNALLNCFRFNGEVSSFIVLHHQTQKLEPFCAA